MIKLFLDSKGAPIVIEALKLQINHLESILQRPIYMSMLGITKDELKVQITDCIELYNIITECQKECDKEYKARKDGIYPS